MMGLNGLAELVRKIPRDDSRPRTRNRLCSCGHFDPEKATGYNYIDMTFECHHCLGSMTLERVADNNMNDGLVVASYDKG